MKNSILWSKNFKLLMCASTLGAMGGIAGSYAMSFLVFDQTGSTLATGFLTAIQFLPHFLLPIFVAPWMDRFPRKPCLVFGDAFSGILFAIVGLYLRHFSFSYWVYLAFSLLINSINAFDALAFNCIFPKVIPQGCEEQGYAVCGMLYPVLNVLIMPVAAFLMEEVGIPNILLIQSGLSFLAAITENEIVLQETVRFDGEKSGFSLWYQDLQEGFSYLRGEKGLLKIYAYDAVANGSGTAFGPILVAFFRTAPGLSAQLYAFFSAAEFIGRSFGGFVRYKQGINPKNRRKFVYNVQQFYNLMDAILLWLPYPWMLLNRGICGFLGINSATVRMSAIARYLPEEYRARVNAFSSTIVCVFGSISAIVLGTIGEVMDYRMALTLASGVCMVLCWLTVGRNKEQLDPIYLYES